MESLVGIVLEVDMIELVQLKKVRVRRFLRLTCAKIFGFAEV